MKTKNSERLNIHVGLKPLVLVITDIPCEDVFYADMVMSLPEMKLFRKEAKATGFDVEDFIFVTPTGPAPEDREMKDGEAGKYVDSHHDEVMKVCRKAIDAHGIQMVVSLGRWAARQVFGGAVAITNMRGTSQWSRELQCNWLPLLSPREVLRFPDRKEIYETDFAQLASLRDHDWNIEAFRNAADGSGYRWCLDLEELVDDPPNQICFDTETVGLEHRSPGFRILSASYTRKKGESLVVPLDLAWWNNPTLMSDASEDAGRLTFKKRKKLLRQSKLILENPEVYVVGHNLKYDAHVMSSQDIEILNWYADTLQLAFLVDENMQRKNLDACVRRWLPMFSGYADSFNEMTDKSRMDTVHHADFLPYAGGDTDVGFRLAGELIRRARLDSRQWETFIKIQMPALRMFYQMERRGIKVDPQALRELGVVLAEQERVLTSSLIQRTPPALLRKYYENGKGVPFDSNDFLAELLFGEDGIRVSGDAVVAKGGKRLKPTVFTDSGKPSTSGKNHLSYFENVDMVQELMEYKKIRKMRTTYVGEEDREEVVPLKRLKNGDLPKLAKDALNAVGIELPKTKVRRRSEIPGLAEAIQNLGGSDTLRVSTNRSKFIEVDLKGNVSAVTPIEAKGFWQYIKDKDHPYIFPQLWLDRTVTGRSASSQPNSQNIPNHGELAKSFRKIFVAEDGYSFCECDLSQAELRVAACMSLDKEMIKVYKEGGDLHSVTAAVIMGVTDEAFKVGSKDNTPLLDVANLWPGAGEYLKQLSPGKRKTVTVSSFCAYKRQCAKAVNFGLLFGMGWRTLKIYARTMFKVVFSDEEAQDIRVAFFKKYHRLADWHEAMRQFLKRNGYVRALHGALRRLPNIASDDEMIVGMTSRMGINSPVQRLSSDLGLIAGARFTRDADPELMHPLMFIHDSNIIQAQEEVMVDEAAPAIKYYMENPPLEEWFDLRLPVPFVADIKIGPNLCDIEERKDIEAIEPEWYRSGEEPTELIERFGESWQALRDSGVIFTG